MRGFSMDVEIQELGDKLPDGRAIEDVFVISEEGYHLIRASINGKEDTVFTHTLQRDDKPTVFIGLCFNPNIETARRLNLCVRSCTLDSKYSPEVLFDFHPPIKIWDGCYKVETLDKTFYVKTHA